MKKLISVLTVIGAFALMSVNSVSAHDSYNNGRLVGRTPCGKPIYAYHQVVARDHCGRNVWQWVTRYPSSCHCGDRHRDYGYNRGHCESGRSYYRPSGWNFNIRF
ncbi:MAG: hypothetical protein K8R87_11520 [Verrucomicrobia bacterium]|nr:hypothetical protein [Verrucomicrobiota bacterium]